MFETIQSGQRVWPTPEDLEAAVELGWPLVWLNPHHKGTTVLAKFSPLLRGGKSATFLDYTTTIDSYSESVARNDSLFFNPHNKRVHEISTPLKTISRKLGSTLVQPLKEFLFQLKATGLELHGITLIVCGSLSSLHVTAASWEELGEIKCLQDFIAIRESNFGVCGSQWATHHPACGKQAASSGCDR